MFRLMSFLLIAMGSVGNCAEPLLYRFDLTIDLNAEDPVHLNAVIPGGDSRVLPVNSDLQFEITTPGEDGMATTVRLVVTGNQTACLRAPLYCDGKSAVSVGLSVRSGTYS